MKTACLMMATSWQDLCQRVHVPFQPQHWMWFQLKTGTPEMRASCCLKYLLGNSQLVNYIPNWVFQWGVTKVCKEPVPQYPMKAENSLHSLILWVGRKKIRKKGRLVVPEELGGSWIWRECKPVPLMLLTFLHSQAYNIYCAFCFISWDLLRT